MNNSKAYAIGSFGVGGVAARPEFGARDSRAYKALVSVVFKSAAFFSGAGNPFFRAIKIHRTYRTLDKLDDHMLKDIGISRSEIGAVAIHSADFPDSPYSGRAS